MISFVVAQEDGSTTFAEELPDDVASMEQRYFKERTQWRLVYWHDVRAYYQAGVARPRRFTTRGPSPDEVTAAAAAAAAAGGSNVVPSEVDGWRLCRNGLDTPYWAQVRLVISIHGLTCNAHV